MTEDTSLYIADTLYSGHLALADTYFRSQVSIFIQNHLYIADTLYSGHLALADTYFRSQRTFLVYLDAPNLSAVHIPSPGEVHPCCTPVKYTSVTDPLK